MLGKFGLLKPGKLPGIQSLLVNGPLWGPAQWDQVRVPLVMNTPQKRQIGSVDLYPNLLVTTLAIVAVSLPPGKPYSESAPPAKRPVLVVDHVRPVTLGINPNPSPVQWSTSAPPPKAPTYIQAQPNYLPLGINPNPSPTQWSTSAPSIKAPAQVDAYPNLAVTTLAAISAPVGVQISDSAPPSKYRVQLDTYPNYLPLGINPNPQASIWTDSAPPPKYAIQVDTYPNLLTTVTFVPPAGVQYTESATSNSAKFQIQVDVPANFTPVIPATIVPAPPAPTPEQPAGKRRIRDIYRITIDGRAFEFKSYSAAVEFLQQAQKFAAELAAKEFARAVEAQKDSREPIEVPLIKPPKIVVSSRELRGEAAKARREIIKVYENASRDIEIAMLLQIAIREKDQEDEIIWLL